MEAASLLDEQNATEAGALHSMKLGQIIITMTILQVAQTLMLSLA